MSLESAIRSDGNSKIPFYFQRKNKKGEWEDIGSVYSPCNNGAWGALKTHAECVKVLKDKMPVRIFP